MNFKRLRYFAKVVDVGSLTQAADLLQHRAARAQPADRDPGGRGPAAVAGPHQARRVADGGRQDAVSATRKRSCGSASRRAWTCRRRVAGVAGPVSVGLAPGTAAATLGVPLIRTIRSQHPGIVPYLNENYGTALSELVMSGRMDLAVLYGNRPVHGLELHAADAGGAVPGRGPARADPIPLAELDGIGLFLPRPYNIVRKLVDENFMRAGIQFRLIAEVESAITLKAADQRRAGRHDFALVHGTRDRGRAPLVVPPHRRPSDRRPH